jgi:hypothetical protein
MIAATASFYQTGGNLPQNAPSSVQRRADVDLYQGLQQGEFCRRTGTVRRDCPAHIDARLEIRGGRMGVHAAGGVSA